jgi:hypothetical protein
MENYNLVFYQLDNSRNLVIFLIQGIYLSIGLSIAFRKCWYEVP